MRKLLVVGSLAVVLAAAFPSDGVTNAQSCSSSTGVTATAVVGSSGPVCSFILSCVVPGTQCFYLVRLDVAGTGQVSGNMAVVPEVGQAFFFDFNQGRKVPAPSCGPALFQCRAGTEIPPGGGGTQVLFIVGDEVNGTGIAHVTCSGGGLAVGESVSCSASELFF